MSIEKLGNPQHPVVGSNDQVEKLRRMLDASHEQRYSALIDRYERVVRENEELRAENSRLKKQQ